MIRVRFFSNLLRRFSSIDDCFARNSNARAVGRLSSKLIPGLISGQISEKFLGEHSYKLMIIYLGGETKQASIIIMSWILAQVSPSSWSHAFTSTDLPWLDSTDLRGFHKRQLCIQHAAENILKILSLSCLTGKIKTRTASGDAGCHLDLHGWWLWSEKDPRDLSQYQRKPCDHK